MRTQEYLGLMYFNGRGVPQDDTQAYMWVNLAASRARGDDRKRYARERDAVAKRMTPQQIANAQRTPREWQAAFEACRLAV